MQRIIIFGAGGHAQVVADILLRAHEAGLPLVPVGCLDDNPALHGQTRFRLPVLGALDDLARVPHDGVVIAVGDNRQRQRLFAQMQQRGECLIVARHPTAIIAPDVVIGAGSVICAGAIVNPGSSIGVNVILNTGCTVDHDNLVANHAHLAPGVHTGGAVQIGTGTLVGIGTIILPQCRVGAWSVVGAATLVTRDLPEGVVAYGSPARVVRHTSGDVLCTDHGRSNGYTYPALSTQ